MIGSFRTGDRVVWLKRVSGEFVFPVTAKVLAVTDKRVKIEADDEEGKVIRFVRPSSLQHREESKRAAATKTNALREVQTKPSRPLKPGRE